MRLDKYLKVSRLIKRRTVANGACDTGRVIASDRVTRASYEVKKGDVLELQLSAHSLEVHVVWVSEYVPEGKASEMHGAASWTEPEYALLRQHICNIT